MILVKSVIYLIFLKFGFDMLFDRSVSIVAVMLIAASLSIVDVFVILPMSIPAIGRYTARVRYTGATVAHGFAMTAAPVLVGIAVASSITLIILHSFSIDFWRLEIRQPYRFMSIDWPDITLVFVLVSTLVFANHIALIWASGQRAKREM